MEVKLADSYGFCYGVKRAIDIAQNHSGAFTLGPLIHNKLEIDRLKKEFNVGLYENIDEVKNNDTVIIRTHGIPKKDLQKIKKKSKVINATCPFVTAPQKIVEQMSREGYFIVLFGDDMHPEVKGVKSYGKDIIVIKSVEELKKINIDKNVKIATIAQTTKQKEKYLDIINYLVLRYNEVRVFNTICDATFENQDAARKLSKEVDIMVVIGGKNSSNTKQLFEICNENIKTFHIENKDELKKEWFNGYKICGVTAGASTPDWIIESVVEKLKEI